MHKTRIPAVVLLCAVIAVSLSMSVVPAFTGGRLGIIAIEGNSLAAIPYGSRVLVLPCGIHPGDTVTAWGVLDGGECDTDRRPTLMVKVFDGQRLVSTGTGATSSDFDLRGKVVAVLPVQKLLPCLGRMSCMTPAPNFPKRTPEQQAEVERQALWRQHERNEFIASGDARWHRFDGMVLQSSTPCLRELRLPEAVERVGIICDGAAGTEVRVCAGQTVFETLPVLTPDVRQVSAPPGRRLDRLIFVLRPAGPLAPRVKLTAVRKLEPQVAQADAL